MTKIFFFIFAFVLIVGCSSTKIASSELSETRRKSASAQGPAYECSVTKNGASNIPTECGKALISEADGYAGAYFDSCDKMSLTFGFLSERYGIRVELAKVKPGKEPDWNHRSRFDAAAVDIISSDEFPKHFRVSRGEEIKTFMGTPTDVMYEADCIRVE